MKKSIKTIVCCLLATILLTACGTQGNETMKDDEKVKITYSTWGNADEKKTEQAIIDEFMEQNKDIQVEMIFVDGSYEEKLQTLIAGNETPDVVSIGSAHIPNFSGAFVPVDASSVSTEKYISEKLVTNLIYDEKQYALPKKATTKVVAYNKDLLERANVDFPSEDFSIEEFSESAKKISELEDGIFGSDPLVFTQMIYQFGGRILSPDGTVEINSKEGKEAAQYMVDAVETYHFTPNAAEAEGTDSLQWFVTSKAGFKNDFGSYYLPQMSEIESFDWDLAPNPGQGGEMEIVGVALSKTSKNQEAANKLITFISQSKEAQEIIGSTSALPVTEDGKKVFLQQYPEKNMQAFFDAMDYENAPAAVKGASQINGDINSALADRTKIGMAGDENVSTVLDEVAAEEQKIIDEANE